CARPLRYDYTMDYW
nr:immunoglobulin heavy chain junction region [Mus musculus]MBK4187980.1 immunoglobulin heavy chain junction region [Mus musculus]